MIRTQFCITVFHNGRGFPDNPSFIYFKSAEEKASFIEAEKKFCAKETAAFNGAESKTEREEKRIAMLKKRAFFAQKMGYGPIASDPRSWFYKPKGDKINA